MDNDPCQDLGRIRNQICEFYNLFWGSDTQTGATPAYVWLADQFGHVFVGFGGLFLILWGISWYLGKSTPSYGSKQRGTASQQALSGQLIWIVAGIGLAAYVAKELWDRSIAGPPTSHWLPSWDTDLVEDVLTDIAFVAIGIILALAHFGVLFGLRPIFVFLALLLVAGGLVRYWVPVFETLGKANIPHLARMSHVNLKREPSPAAARSDAECDANQAGSGPSLQCVLDGSCAKTHHIIYGLTKEDTPEPPQRSSSNGERGADDAVQVAIPNFEEGRIKKVLPEVRKLGIALIAEQAFRKRNEDIYYTTIFGAVEGTIKQKFLVIDSIDRDITRYTLSFSSRITSSLDEKLTVLEGMFKAEPGSWRRDFFDKSVIWLSLSEPLAVALCQTLVGNKGDSEAKIVLIRASLPEENAGRGKPAVSPQVLN